MTPETEGGHPSPFSSWIFTGISAGLFLFFLGAVLYLGSRLIVLPAAEQTDDLARKNTDDYGSLGLEPRQALDTGGFLLVMDANRWPSGTPLEEIARIWDRADARILKELDTQAAVTKKHNESQLPLIYSHAGYLMSAGKAAEAYTFLKGVRDEVQRRGKGEAKGALANLIYFQGIAALRLGENDNCILCRGESSCILPIRPEAIHQNPAGSRLAIAHFTEYLHEFPDDLEVQWLLNLAHMTLGEFPEKVDTRYRLNLDRFLYPQAGIGKFRDIGHLTGLSRLNQAGGVVMDDFDNDGLLDLAVTCWDPRKPLALYKNLGNGQFEDRAKHAGVLGQLGGLTLVQTDYNNDGLLDLFIPRGAWLGSEVRPSLLRNDGNLHFTDVTQEAGLAAPCNSNCAQWADFDNDGFADLFLCCEKQPHRLYRNRGNGTFEEVATKAGLNGDGQTIGKGANWIDFDNDDFPDLFINYLGGKAQLYRNNRNGTFANVSEAMGIDGPEKGFSCWCWDFNNDGHLDLFATSYDRSLKDAVLGIQGKPHGLKSNKLFLNKQGKGFVDVAKEAGLDMVFAAMGSNFGDFDGDGFLDFYLGTGDPNIATLVPNRMFQNVQGKSFVEITGSAGVGHLQKGHGVACGDWDRDGNNDLFIVMGGAIEGDKYHNILFQNPGQNRSWLRVRLVGKKTNRAAHGARIKVAADSGAPLTVHRHISSGSSFGGNPLEQTIGLGLAKRIATLEVHWPTSQTTQVFRDVDVNQAIEITEFETAYKKLKGGRIDLSSLSDETVREGSKN